MTVPEMTITVALTVPTSVWKLTSNIQYLPHESKFQPIHCTHGVFLL
jgi:hypothetical protein